MARPIAGERLSGKEERSGLAGRARLDGQRMDALDQQLGERLIHQPLAGDAIQALEGGRDDLDGEMALATRIMAGVAPMLLAVVDHGELCRRQGGGEAAGDFGGDGASGSCGHPPYIAGFAERRGVKLADEDGRRRSPRFHGRVESGRMCEEPGCDLPGEFRAPAGDRARNDGPPHYRWFCLDHVRAFNARYNFFAGMDAAEIEAAQRPYAGWERETRAFSHVGADLPPRWSDFGDPLDAIGARFRKRMDEARAEQQARADGRPLGREDRRSLKVLGLGIDADRRAVRARYAELVRQYHPDRNGGDRSHEKALQDVIAAYTQLKSAPAFA